MNYEDFMKYAKKVGLKRYDLVKQIGVASNTLYNYKDGKNLRIKNLIKLQDFTINILLSIHRLPNLLLHKLHKVNLKKCFYLMRLLLLIV